MYGWKLKEEFELVRLEIVEFYFHQGLDADGMHGCNVCTFIFFLSLLYISSFSFLAILISNLDIFKGAETIAGEEESYEARYRGNCTRVEVGECQVVAEDFHIIIIII